MGETIEIRPLVATDLEAVIRIDMASTGISRRGYFEKRLVAATDRPGDYVYVGLLSDGKLSGFTFAKLVNGEFGKPGASASLDAISVDPDHIGKQYGQQLLDRVEQVLAAKGVETLTSQFDWSHRAMLGFFSGAGYHLSPRVVLMRSTKAIAPKLEEDRDDLWDDEPDYSDPGSDDFSALSHDRVPVRTMLESDLRKIISIDKAGTGTNRSEYYQRKQHEALHQTGIRVSLVAEQDDFPVGFIMARVDFGEFGHASAEAEMDAIGVDPGYKGRGVGQALMAQLIASLGVLNVDSVRTEIDWNDVDLITYFSAAGFVPAQRVTLQRSLQ
jgi:ribosomal protein S18 acetylase RimI-like enzyme